MNEHGLTEVLEVYRQVEDVLSTTIRISHGQVVEIVVSDLIDKYKVTRDKHIETVLLAYYLTSAEMNERLK